MKAEEIRIAVAEACGWTRIGRRMLDRVPIPFGRTDWMGTPPRDKDKLEDDQGWKRIPDYPNDLNAVHEAEKMLETTCEPAPFTQPQVSGYYNHLMEMCGTFGAIRATALQRCEAILRTLGKWTKS